MTFKLGFAVRKHPMRIFYVLLSPTFGMHQYTSDLASRMLHAGHDVHLITTSRGPLDRYPPGLPMCTPLRAGNSGLERVTLRFDRLWAVKTAIVESSPDVVHFTGPHIWNLPLVRMLSSAGIPLLHTLHDLEPHQGTRYGFLLRMWNSAIIRSVDHLLVHGERYRERLLQMGVGPHQVTHTPLTHLPLSFACQEALATQPILSVNYEPFALFFGRLKPYKGLDCLLSAYGMMEGPTDRLPGLVIAGPGTARVLQRLSIPRGVEVRNRLITDEETIELFRRCGILVMPYSTATQSALVATAYYFSKPVLVTRAGALPEYVEDGRTGRIVEPGQPVALARCMQQMLCHPGQLTKMGSAGRTLYVAYRAAETKSLFSMYARVA